MRGPIPHPSQRAVLRFVVFLTPKIPAFVIDQLKWKAGDRLIEQIGKYQKYGADKALAGRLKGFIEQVKGMPSTAARFPPRQNVRETAKGFQSGKHCSRLTVRRFARAILADVSRKR